jgi:hypothetical protein
MVLVLLAATAWFAYRGPWRALHGGGYDYQAPYVSCVRFAHGLNPYSVVDYVASWQSVGSSTGMTYENWLQQSVYPPSTFLVMFPFALLSWMHSLALLDLVSVVLYGHVLYLLAREVGTDWGSWRRVGFVAFGLALSPVQTGLAVGNPSILVFLLCTYSLLWSRSGSRRALLGAGVLLAVSLCLKPTVGVLLLGTLVLARKWKPVVIGVGAAGVIGAAALLAMRRFPGWWLDYKENVSALFGPSGPDNFTNGFRFDILNLQVPFYELTRSVRGANLVSWGLVLVLFGAWFLMVRRKPSLEGRWGTVAALLILGLLPIYHRNYDSGFVLLAILWGFQRLGTRYGRLVLLFGVVLLFPGESLLRHLGNRWPVLVRPSFFMDFFVYTQLTWALVGIVVVLLWGMRHDLPEEDRATQLQASEAL